MSDRGSDGDRLARCQEGFLLLQLLGAPERELPKGEANKPLQRALFKGRLGLTASRANALRKSMGDCVAEEKRGRVTWFRITDAGVERLLELPQYPADLPVNGRAIERLLQAARGGARAIDAGAAGEATVEAAAVAMDDAAMRDAIRAEWESARAERAHRRLVPIHELRERIRRTHGAAAASRDRFDVALRALWSAGELELIPISDARDATPEQLDASLRGLHQTLFYVEVAR